MPLAYFTPTCRVAALAALGLSALPMVAQAELRPAVLPAEICLVLSNGPFDADVAALIQGREDFAAILVEAEASCPDLVGNLVGATATIPATVPNNETEGPGDFPVTPTPDVVTIPVDEEPDPGPDPEPPVEECPDPDCGGPIDPEVPVESIIVDSLIVE